jgi:translation initiation factor IF-2
MAFEVFDAYLTRHMTDGNEHKETPAGGRKPLTLSRTTNSGTVRQSFSHGRSNTVTVEVREKRQITRPGAGAAPAAPPAAAAPPARQAAQPRPAAPASAPAAGTPKRPATPAPTAAAPAPAANKQASITDDEARRRNEAVSRALAERKDREDRQRAEEEQRRALEDAQRKRLEEEQAAQDALEARRRAEEEQAEREARLEAAAKAADAAKAAASTSARNGGPAATAAPVSAPDDRGDILSELGGRLKSSAARRPAAPAPAKPVKKGEPRRREGKLTLEMVERLNEGDDERVRSLAAFRRAQQKEKERRAQQGGAKETVVREVVIPEVITVQELANRMATRAADVIKYLMRQGQMAKLSDELDADTAELIATEFGHAVKRVSEGDVEDGLEGEADQDEDLTPRAPIVTIMGHVDHGKTSLLDALRKANVAAGEAGGITQHIGAYQAKLPSGESVTFLDTPGHAAFSAMRSRGAQVTDIVVLVVAADDGVMPQTVEAISHAKAAGVPIIVAVNKIDKPGGDPQKVLNELLQYEVITEAVGGDTLAVQVSALKKIGLDKLIEAILLQAEVLALKANPDRSAEGIVVEAKLEKGRGAVATALVQRGTLRRGDIVVAGGQWGRVRALINEHGQQVSEAGPAVPVEIMGLDGAPDPGDRIVVVDSENRAREVAEYRQRKKRNRPMGGGPKTSLEQMMARIKDSTAKELGVVIKADVQGSAEAIQGALDKLSTDEVRARVLQAAVGAISEADVTLAKASGAPLIGFNVRASKEARELADREGIEIRYYSIIYELIDDIKGVMSGMLAPITRETFLGNAEVLETFQIAKIGRVAGCRVTDGVVRKGAKVRILRDNVVIQEMGVLNTLKRFKDEVNEVYSGQECGMSFGSFQDLKVGDVIECFNVDVVQRSL